MALCFNCGHTKFGAIVPCPESNVGSTGDMNLNIAISDHGMSVATIGAFGAVVRAIRRVCEDDQLRLWSFIRFVSVNHGDILAVQMPREQAAACDAVLARAHPPSRRRSGRGSCASISSSAAQTPNQALQQPAGACDVSGVHT